jgi:hypothetical protein
MSQMSRFPICPICNEAVEIKTAKTDEDGKAVHEECYARETRTKQSQHIAISPMALACPRCDARAGRVCALFDGEVEVVHVERIAAALVMDVAAAKN